MIEPGKPFWLLTKPLHERLIERATAEWDVSWGEVIGSIKEQRIVLARQAVMFALHAAGFSSTQIGKALGREHTTVLHGIKAARRRMDADAGYRRKVDAMAHMARQHVIGRSWNKARIEAMEARA
jgi:chromosomal replication initiation ATPase DnaA